MNPSANVVSNVFHYVAGLDGDEDGAIQFERGPDEGTVYFEGNLVPGGESDAVSNGDRLAIPDAATVTTYDASDLGSRVVPRVGTHYPTKDEETLLGEIAAAISP